MLICFCLLTIFDCLKVILVFSGLLMTVSFVLKLFYFEKCIGYYSICSIMKLVLKLLETSLTSFGLFYPFYSQCLIAL